MSANTNNPNFVDSVLAGDALDTDIDDFADRWQSSNEDTRLADALGFSDNEYALWVEQPVSLRSILHSKRHGIDLEKNVNWDEAHLLAARSMSEGESSVLIDWLKQNGYIP